MKLLIFVDTLFALPLSFAIPFALCADVVAKHGTEDEVFFGRELVQRTGNDEPDGLQTFAPPEIHVQVLLSSGLEHVRDALTFQPFNGQFTIFLITGEKHHLALSNFGGNAAIKRVPTCLHDWPSVSSIAVEF